MPRNVRNFWIDLKVDGQTTRVETGPKAAGGGFDLVILQRDEGGIVRSMKVQGFASTSGELELRAYLLDTPGDPSISRTTKR